MITNSNLWTKIWSIKKSPDNRGLTVLKPAVNTEILTCWFENTSRSNVNIM